MTEYWEVKTKDGYQVIRDPHQILDAIKKGLEKGDVSINGKRVRIVQRDGKDAWEYLPGF